MRTGSGVRREKGSAATGGAVALLVAGTLLAGFLLLVTYGFTVEYGDTGAGVWITAGRTYTEWGVLGLIPAGVLLLAAVVGRTRRWVAITALGVLALTVAALPVLGVLAVEEKYDRYPVVPSCTDELTAGPAKPVVEAAQRGFEEIEHPNPFSGGGSSGVDGCSSELMVRGDEDPTEHYRSALPAAGWKVVTDTDPVLRAEKGGQAFELTVDAYGMWMVWIGPEDLEPQQLQEGEVGPRR